MKVEGAFMRQVGYFLFVMAIHSQSLFAIDVWVQGAEDEPFLLSISEQETLGFLCDFVKENYQGGLECQEIVMLHRPAHEFPAYTSRPLRKTLSHSAAISHPRHYFQEMTQEEKKEIDYIITTLADKSHGKLLLERGALEKAGARVDHIHPLRFFLYVFQEERLKVGMHNIRHKFFVWDDFIQRIKNTLDQEREHITMEMIDHFATHLGIDSDYIAGPIFHGQWIELIDILIQQVPRQQGYDRYGF